MPSRQAIHKRNFLLAENNPDQLAAVRMRGVQLGRPSTINGGRLKSQAAWPARNRAAVEAAAVERP